MKKIRTFRCEAGHKFDRMVKDSVREVKCECRAVAVRVLSAARYFSNTVGKSPSAR